MVNVTCMLKRTEGENKADYLLLPQLTGCLLVALRKAF